MSELDLNGPRGYFKDLASPAFDDFWCVYQADNPLDRENFSLVYRRLIAACILLNHVSDKVAANLWPSVKKGADRLANLDAKVEAISKDAKLDLDACRHFSNDLKHIALKLHTAEGRERESAYDNDGLNQVFCFYMKYQNSPDPVDICLAAGGAYRFWRAYFSNEFTL